jgi:hypothetical protein
MRPDNRVKGEGVRWCEGELHDEAPVISLTSRDVFRIADPLIGIGQDVFGEVIKF